MFVISHIFYSFFGITMGLIIWWGSWVTGLLTFTKTQYSWIMQTWNLIGCLMDRLQHVARNLPTVLCTGFVPVSSSLKWPGRFLSWLIQQVGSVNQWMMLGLLEEVSSVFVVRYVLWFVVVSRFLARKTVYIAQKSCLSHEPQVTHLPSHLNGPSLP